MTDGRGTARPVAGPGREAARTRRDSPPQTDATLPDRNDLLDLYRRLLECYGPQGWWPGDGPFDVIVGAILTQNTAWRNVEQALARLQAAGVRDVGQLREIATDELAALVAPAGYYRQKARKLKELASLVHDRFGGRLDALLALEASVMRRTLLAVWGIGDETADAITLYAAGKASFVIDAFTIRILSRLGWVAPGRTYGYYQSLFMDRLPPDATLFNEYHALFVRHAHTACRPRPRCADCCLLGICPTGARQARALRGGGRS